jgi:hypothetical protein
MQQFAVVLKEMRRWLTGYEWVNFLLPYEMFILFGSLGIIFIGNVLQVCHVYWHGIYVINSICYFSFLLGILLTLISHNVKYLPYGLWFYAFILLFPFNYFSVGLILKVVLYAYLGYALIRFTAVTDTSYLDS